MVPPKFVLQIKQGRHRALKIAHALVRSEGMEQRESLKYDSALRS